MVGKEDGKRKSIRGEGIGRGERRNGRE